MSITLLACEMSGGTDGEFGKNYGDNREDGNDAHSCDDDDLSDGDLSGNEDDGEFGGNGDNDREGNGDAAAADNGW